MEFNLKTGRLSKLQRKIAFAEANKNWTKHFAFFPKFLTDKDDNDDIKCIVWFGYYYRKVDTYSREGTIWWEYKSESEMKQELAKNLADKH